MMKVMITVVVCVVLVCDTALGESIFCGNEIKERGTSGADPSITPIGPRIWIDDPLNGESWARWGYLQAYRIYIHGSPSLTGNLPGLYLQIWTNSTQYNNYSLKWQKKLDNYNTGREYEVYPNAGEVVEVNNFDRIGFTSDGNFSLVALDFETDDVTGGSAHRSYFRLLYRDNYVLPVVGNYRLADNNALRGRFSIGIRLNKAPPTGPNEIYKGNELIRRELTSGVFGRIALMDNSFALVIGKVTGFYFRLDQLNSTTSIQLHVWRKKDGTNYVLLYSRTETISAGPEKTYNVSIADGPFVDESCRIGWLADKVFISASDNGSIYLYYYTTFPTFTVGQTYTFDGLRYDYMASIGAVIASTSLSTPTEIQPKKTTTRSGNAVPVTEYNNSSSLGSHIAGCLIVICLVIWQLLA